MLVRSYAINLFLCRHELNRRIALDMSEFVHVFVCVRLCMQHQNMNNLENA